MELTDTADLADKADDLRILVAQHPVQCLPCSRGGEGVASEAKYHRLAESELRCLVRELIRYGTRA